MNTLKTDLKSARVRRGLFLSSGSEVIAEMAGRAGFDWVLIDMEHGVGNSTTLLHQLQALSGTAATPIVRVGSNTPEVIRNALDLGAAGIMIPHVDTAEEARQAVAASRYAPEGLRGMSSSIRAGGFGLHFKNYLQTAVPGILVIAQIETPTAVNNAGAIAAVDGIDVLFIGPSDLTQAMGIHGQTEHPDFLAACKTVTRACEQHSRSAGILARSEQDIQRASNSGFRMVGIGSDLGILANGMRELLKE